MPIEWSGGLIICQMHRQVEYTLDSDTVDIISTALFLCIKFFKIYSMVIWNIMYEEDEGWNYSQFYKRTMNNVKVISLMVFVPLLCFPKMIPSSCLDAAQNNFIDHSKNHTISQ